MRFESRITARDGRELAVLVSTKPRREGEQQTGSLLVFTDITERRAAEQALREQRTLLAEAQKLAGLGCWEWDPATGRVNWSDEMYSIYGVEPGEFRPSFESYLERIHPLDRARAAATVALALMDNRAFSMDERILRPDGMLLAFFSTADPRSTVQPMYTKHVVVDRATLQHRPYPAARGKQRPLLNRDIQRLFEPLRITEQFLLKTNLREVLFRKPAETSSSDRPETGDK